MRNFIIILLIVIVSIISLTYNLTMRHAEGVYSKVDTVYVPLDTLPPVCVGWVIEGDSIFRVDFSEYRLDLKEDRVGRLADGEPVSGSSRWVSGWIIWSESAKAYKCTDVFYTRTEACAELQKRLFAREQEMMRKRTALQCFEITILRVDTLRNVRAR